MDNSVDNFGCSVDNFIPQVVDNVDNVDNFRSQMAKNPCYIHRFCILIHPIYFHILHTTQNFMHPFISIYFKWHAPMHLLPFITRLCAIMPFMAHDTNGHMSIIPSIPGVVYIIYSLLFPISLPSTSTSTPQLNSPRT